MITFLLGFMVGFAVAIGASAYLLDRRRKIREIRMKQLRKGNWYVR
jgi:hypothetical protein